MAELPQFGPWGRRQELRRLCDQVERESHTWGVWRLLVMFWRLRRVGRRLRQAQRRQARVLAR